MPEGHVVMNNVMFGPLVISGRAEGIIGLANKPSDFTEEDARIVMALSNLVAIGLRKAKVEMELRESKERLSETIAELQIYASLLRHDLSNDLQLIIGEIQLAQLKAVENAKLRESVTTIESASSRMLRLLQVFNRTEYTEEYNLIEILRHLVSEAKSSYPGIAIRFHDNSQAQIISIKGRSLLPFVFDNIIRNAVQHVSPTVEIDIHITLDPDKATLDFVDNGPGIDKEVVTRLFEKTTTEEGGGFGLYLCHKIIETYQGSMSLLDHDVYNSGTSIRVTLPRIEERVKERAH
ncbi:MAG: GAF domain-containing sensor histidine kinase [Candidatus Thorarchaeota archaeon]